MVNPSKTESQVDLRLVSYLESQKDGAQGSTASQSKVERVVFGLQTFSFEELRRFEHMRHLASRMDDGRREGRETKSSSHQNLRRGKSLEETRLLARRSSSKNLIERFGLRKRRVSDPGMSPSAERPPRCSVESIVAGNVGESHQRLVSLLLRCRSSYPEAAQRELYDLAVADLGNAHLASDYAQECGWPDGFCERLMRRAVFNGSAFSLIAELTSQEVREHKEADRDPANLLRSQSAATMLTTAFLKHPRVGGDLIQRVAEGILSYLETATAGKGADYWVSIDDMARAKWRGVGNKKLIEANKERFLKLLPACLKDACYEVLTREANGSLRHLLGLRYNCVRSHYPDDVWVYVGELLILRGLVPAMTIQAGLMTDRAMKSVYQTIYKVLQCLSTGVAPGVKCNQQLDFIDEGFDEARKVFLEFLALLTKEPSCDGSLSAD